MAEASGSGGASASEGMDQRVRAYDWLATPLGAIDAWPPSLYALVNLMLAADQPMFMAWGPEQTWLYNQAFIPILGQKHPAALGRPSAEVWAEGWADIGPMFDRVFAGEALYMEDIALMLDRHGALEEAHFAFAYTPARDDNGVVCGLFGNCIETTAQVLATREQAESEERLRQLNADLERKVIERSQARGTTWQLSPDLMGALNSEGYFETSNPAWKTVLGWTEAEVAGMSIFELLHPDDVERTRGGFALTQAGEPAIDFANRYRKKDGGYRWISWVGVPDEGMVYCSGRDITDAKAAEAELAAAQDALRQSQKMEAVGQLTGGIAHDFNNLLAGISGSLELLETRIAEARYSDLERLIDAALGSTRRAASLTQRLLAFSRRQVLDPKPVDLNSLVAGVDELLRRTLGPEIAMQVVAAETMWLTKVDPLQLENALLNLAINARDAMPDGGRMTIETANQSLDGKTAKDRELPPGQYVSLSVADTGSGMAPDVIERAFDPFYTTKPLGQGTGLGLSMIHGFVRQSGGQVRIQSELGSGTTMTLYLPRFTGAVEETDAPERARSADTGRGETVLIIDDEPIIRMLMLDVLEEAGYIGLEADDGPSGLDILRSDPNIVLLITDVGLPGGMNGRQVADAARATKPDLKVLFVTGYAENAVVGDGQLEPGMQVITKPFALTAFGGKVREMIGG